MSIPNNEKIWETRRKNGKTTPWNKGIKHSEETKAKIKEKRKKQIFTQETREKLSKSLKGRIVSKETRKKMSDSRRGEKSYNWKGGMSSLVKSIRQTYLYRQWRSDCFTRDDFTCQHCQKRGYVLQVDHIKPLGFIIAENGIKNIQHALCCEELWNINNGRTLCLDCHRKTDTWGGNTKKALAQAKY